MTTSLFTPLLLAPALSQQGLFMGAAKLAFYQTGTTTLASVYDADGDPISQSANTHGVVGVEADAYGRFPAIYLDDAVIYRVVLRTATGVLVPKGDVDPVVPTGYAIVQAVAQFGEASGSDMIGFSQDEDYSAGTVGFHIKKFRCVTDAPYGAKGNGTDDDTAAINAALADGGDLHFDGSFKITDRLLATANKTNIILHGDTSIQGSPWEYPGSQTPFGSLLLITGDDCSVIGAGIGCSSISVTGTSQANAVTFQNCKGARMSDLSLIGNKGTGTAIADDTFQTGFNILNATASNPGGEFSNASITRVEMSDWLHYGGQTYGDLTSATLLDCWSHDNGKAGDALSVGCGLALTRGPRNVKVLSSLIEGNKLHGLLGTSAGLDAYDLGILFNTIRNNGGWGSVWLEESDFASIAGAGLDGLISQANQIYGNDLGGEWFGTFDGVGYVRNVRADNNVRDNGGPGTQVNTNDDPANRTSNVDIRSRITGNAGGGLIVGVNMDDTVQWDATRISGNTTFDIQNSGDSHLVSNARGQGVSVASASTVTLPAAGDVFIVTGNTNITSIDTAGNQGRKVTLIFAPPSGTTLVSDGSNLILATDFTASGNDTLQLVCGESSWFEISRSHNE